MSEWREVKVDEIKASSKNSAVTGPFGSSIGSQFFLDAGVPVIRGSNLSEDIGTRLIDKDLVFISHEKAQEFSRSTARKGDLIFTCWGTVSQVGLIDDRSKFSEYVISNKQMKLTPAPEIADSLFLYYLFSSPQVRRSILQNAIGSSVPGFNLGQLKSITLILPSLLEQQKITSLLNGLDRKIENLRKQNETLERIAQTLFKHWFVDFEFPFDFAQGKPKGDGKPYKSSGGKMERSELGEIPAGWRVAPFETTFLIPLRNGLTKPRSVRGSGFYMVNMGELFGNKRIGDLEMDRVELSDSEYEKSLLEVGDILFARQSLVREGAGQCSIITEAPEPRTFEGHLIRCRIDHQKANPFYFFYHFWSFAGGFQMRSLVEQVAAAGIRGSELAKLEMLIPPVELQNKFFTVIEPLEKSIALNFRRIRTLTKTRDVLLPKLMSGKLRITES